MRALITNDDGIGSVGIRTLASEAVDAGLEVVVAAPSWDSSGASASLTAVEREGRLLLTRASFDGLPVVAYGVEAAPAFIVRAAIHGAFGEPPDLVLSGVNHGRNTGHAVLHSGTVGAVLTAATFGRTGAAFSLDAPGGQHWETAARVVGEVLGWLVRAGSPVTLNVNIPDVPLDELKGIERARLAPFGAVQTNVTDTGEGYVKLAYTELEVEAEAGTDSAFLADGWACYTAVRAACEAAGDDVLQLARQRR